MRRVDVSVSIEEDDTDINDIKKSEFIGKFVMEVAETKNGKMAKDFPMEIAYQIDEYRFAMEPRTAKRKEEIIMIFDRKNRKITNKIVDSKGKKTASVMPMMKIRVGVSKKNIDSYLIEPTGKTKTIMGYSCKEYRIEGPDETSFAWVASDITFSANAFGNFAYVKDKSGAQNDWSNLYGIKGMALETRSESKDGKTVRTTVIKSLKVGEVDTAFFSLDGYEVNDISNMLGR